MTPVSNQWEFNFLLLQEIIQRDLCIIYSVSPNNMILRNCHKISLSGHSHWYNTLINPPIFTHSCVCIWLYALFKFYLLTFGCVESSMRCAGFLQFWNEGWHSSCGAQASHFGGSRAFGLQQLWLMGLSCPTARGIFLDEEIKSSIHSI